MSEPEPEHAVAPARVHWLWWAFVATIALYLAPFIVALLDDVVLRTHRLPTPSPAVKRAFATAYAPLVWIVELFHR